MTAGDPLAGGPVAGDASTGAVRRLGQVIGVRPERLQEYRQLHAAPWPAVLETLRRCHVRNYSIFYHAGLLFAYFEYTGDDWARDQARIAADPATQAWWARTDPCQQRLPDAAPGAQWSELEPVFFMP